MMSDPNVDRLASIRAANAKRRLNAADGVALDGVGTEDPHPAPATVDEALLAPPLRDSHPVITHAPAAWAAPSATAHDAPPLASAASAPADPDAGVNPESLGFIALAAAGGALIAVVLPMLFPGLVTTLLAPESRVYWSLSRASAFSAYIFLWLALVLRLMVTSRLSDLWPGGARVFTLDKYASMLGLALALFHALLLLGDRFLNYTFVQLLVPFASGGAAAGWVGIGQVSLYLLGIVGLSGFFHSRLGRVGAWLISALSFVTFGLVLLHGVMSGSASGSAWAQILYWLSGGSLLFLSIYGLLFRVTRSVPVAVTDRKS